MKTMSFKLPDGLHALLEATVRERQTAKSDLVREALTAYLTDAVRPGSFAVLTEDLAGTLDGPCDLATSPSHLAGFGQGRDQC